MHNLRILSVLAILATVACGGDDSKDDDKDGGGGKVTASFTSAASADIDTPVAFDASASTSKSSSIVSYDWSFGNGNRGSGTSIAQIFRDAGSFQVKLTVTDADGNVDSVTRPLTINPPATDASVSATGRVTTLDGTTPLEGVVVTDKRTGASAMTDALGNVTLTVAVGRGVVLELVKDGYANQIVSLRLPASVGEDASFEGRMRTRGPVQDFDAHEGGRLSGADGALVDFPLDALADAGGNVRGGTAQIAITPVDITLPAAGGFPGEFTGVNGDGSTTPIVSFGTTEYAIAADGERLNLAAGKRAIVELPVYADAHLDGTALTIGERIPLWSLDEQSGVWVNEGDGEIIASPDSPGGYVMRAEVGHFSWWNADIGFDPTRVKPKCVPDTVPGADDYLARATICNMLTDIDRGLGGNGNGISALRMQTVQRLPGFAATTTIEANNEQLYPVPSNTNLKFVGSALNGTWRGETFVRSGPSGQVADVVVTMRPVEGVVDGEIITLPFDETRAVQDNTPVRFVFNSPGDKFLQVRIGAGDGSSLQGAVAVRDSSGQLVSRTFGTSAITVTQAVVSPGVYGIEITPSFGAPGTFRLEASLVGTVETESLFLPISFNRGIAALTVYRMLFDIPSAIGLAGTLTGSNVSYRISGPTGATIARGATGEFGTTVPAGQLRFDVYSNDGAAVPVNFSADTTLWPSAAPDFTVTSANDVRLLPQAVDRNGALVVGYWVGEGGYDARFESKRLTGTTFTSLPTLDDATIWAQCSNFGFDANNDMVYVDPTPASYSTPFIPQLRARRYVGGAWQDIGPRGLLPGTGPATTSTCNYPFIVVAGGELYVAYNVDQNLRVARFDGSNWVGVGASDGIVPNAAAAGQGSWGTHHLAVSPDDKLTLVHAPYQEASRVSQFNGSSWVQVGGNLTAPVMPGSIYSPRVAFDTANRPRVGGAASQSEGGSGTTQMYVYTFDGANWTGSGPLHTGTVNGYVQSGDIDHVYFGGASYTINTETFASNNSTIVKRYDGAWSSVGADRGQVYGLSQNFYRHFAVSGGNLYIVAQPQVSPPRITVRRYTP